MVALPAPAQNVAGLLPGDPPLTVLAPYGTYGEHVIVMHVDDQDCGLLVESVTGLRRIDEDDIRPAPRGQETAIVAGSIVIDGEMVLVVDPRAIADSAT
jgi:chemotaxis signal transduction protein